MVWLCGGSVRLVAFVVAIRVEVLDSVPESVDVDVGDDLESPGLGNELDRRPASGANCCIPGFDQPQYSATGGEVGFGFDQAHPHASSGLSVLCKPEVYASKTRL